MRCSPIRVLQVSAYAPPHLGGIEICAAQLFDTLTALGCEVTWIASDVPQVGLQERRIRVPVFNQIEDWYGVPIPIPTFSAVRNIWRSIADCDVVHVHDVLYLNCLLAVLFGRLKSRPIVVTLHRWPLAYRNRWVTLLQNAAHHLLGRLCLRSANAITCIHVEVLRKAEAFTRRRCQLIPNGIAQDFSVRNTEITADLQHSLRAHLRLPLDRKIAVFAGRFVENKGLHEIRAIANSLPDVLFVMCGSGPINPGDWGLTNVLVRGLLSSTDLRELFLASDFLLLPSTEGGFPLVVPEAMACGLPCCILRETWLALGRGEDYFILLERDRLVDRIVEYLDSPLSFCKRNALAGFAKGNWDWEKSTAQYLRVYTQVLDREPDG